MGFFMPGTPFREKSGSRTLPKKLYTKKLLGKSESVLYDLSRTLFLLSVSRFLKLQETFFKKFLGGVWGKAPYKTKSKITSM